MHFCTYGKRALTCLCFPAPEQLQEGQRMHVVPLTVSVNAVLNYKLGRPLTALSINRLPSKHPNTFQRNKEQSLFWDSARKDADKAQTRLRFTSLASSLALQNNKSPTHTGVHLPKQQCSRKQPHGVYIVCSRYRKPPSRMESVRLNGEPPHV